MGRYRSRLEIIADILSVVRGGAKKTEIMYQANLSYTLLIRYLKYVEAADLVTHGSENSFMLTEKGLDFLKEFNDYNERQQKIERQLEGINDERAMLENRFLNAGLWNCPSEKGRMKKKA